MKKHQHYHMCFCGDYFVCTQPADQCAVPEPFQCMNCAMQQFDRWLSDHQPFDNHATTQEPNRHEKH